MGVEPPAGWEAVVREATQAEREEAAAAAQRAEALSRELSAASLGGEAQAKRAALQSARAQWVGRESEVESAKHLIADAVGASFRLGPELLGGKQVVHLRGCRDCAVLLPAGCVLAKLFLEGCERVSLRLEGRLLTGHLEAWRCTACHLLLAAPLPTLQLDLCGELRVEYEAEALLGCVVHAAASALLLVGPAVQHALEPPPDAPHAQCITRLVGGALLTERVVRDGSDYPTTARELLQRRQEAAAEAAAAGAPLPPDPTLPLLAAAAGGAAGGAEAAALEAALSARRAEAARLRGNDAFAACDWATAAVEYTASLAAAEGAAARSNRAAAFLKLGRHQQALEDARAAARLAPDSAKAHFREGLALHALKRFAEAGLALSRAAALEPANAAVRRARRRRARAHSRADARRSRMRCASHSSRARARRGLGARRTGAVGRAWVRLACLPARPQPCVWRLVLAMRICEPSAQSTSTNRRRRSACHRRHANTRAGDPRATRGAAAMERSLLVLCPTARWLALVVEVRSYACPVSTSSADDAPRRLLALCASPGVAHGAAAGAPRRCAPTASCPLFRVSLSNLLFSPTPSHGPAVLQRPPLLRRTPPAAAAA